MWEVILCEFGSACEWAQDVKLKLLVRLSSISKGRHWWLWVGGVVLGVGMLRFSNIDF